MHILGAKQFIQYISDEKTSAFRVEARLLNPYWMLMQFDIKRTAELAALLRSVSQFQVP